MKKLLIVSYHYPPDAEVGAIRPAEFSRHLPENGWEPLILTVKEKYYKKLDFLKYETRGTRIYRTSKIGSINDVYIWVKRKGFFNNRRKISNTFNNNIKGNGDKIKIGDRIMNELKRYFNSMVVYLPDEHNWFFFAFIKGSRLIREADVIFTTSPPHSVQLIGLTLKLISGKPWISDFRDPWEVEVKPQRSRSKLSDFIEKRMERVVISRCDRVISVTVPMTERLKALYPEFIDKFVTISNGYNPDSLSAYIGLEKYKKFTISYIGSMYFNRNPFLFLSALSSLIDEGKLEREEVRVRFIGDCRTSDENSVEDMVKDLALSDVVEIIDHVTQKEALIEAARSHVLLLLAPHQPLQIPGKVYEYIGLRSVILSVCGKGATRDLMDEYPMARNVSPEDRVGMKEAILHFYVGMKSTIDMGKTRYPFRRYERKAISEQLVSILDDLSKS